MKYEKLIRQTFEVVGVSGEEFVCMCLWHNDSGKPNLYVNGKKGLYLCHSCGAKGHMSKMGPVPTATSDELKERMTKLRSVTNDQHQYSEAWLSRFDFPHDYWTSRGLSTSIREKFDLGYDPLKDVLTIPVRDEDGVILGTIIRRLDDQKPKYLYPAGFKIGRHLFGAWLLKEDQRHTVALVEGSIDAIACWDARVPALAMLGARLTVDQRDVLKRLGVKTVVVFTDNDNAGRNAVYQVKEQLRHTGINVKVAVYRSYWSAKDPAELRPEQRRKAYHSALPWHRWIE